MYSGTLPYGHFVNIHFLDLDNMIAECSSFSQSRAPGQTWTNRMVNLGQSWATTRPNILKAVLAAEYITTDSQCLICKDSKPSCIRCHQCGIQAVICVDCDEEIHLRNPLHDREIFYEGFFNPVAPTISMDSSGDLITVCEFLFIYLFQY